MPATLQAFIFSWLVFASTATANAQEIWTIGPMLHWNFGGEKKTTSFAIETAYWNIYHFPYSLDFAIEFDQHRIRLYSEAQTGVGLFGIAAGPVVEFNTRGDGTHLGFQGSGWANYIIGGDYRVRFIDKKKYHSFGLYAKIPIATAGLEEDHNSSSSFGWHHSSDWWD